MIAKQTWMIMKNSYRTIAVLIGFFCLFTSHLTQAAVNLPTTNVLQSKSINLLPAQTQSPLIKASAPLVSLTPPNGNVIDTSWWNFAATTGTLTINLDVLNQDRDKFQPTYINTEDNYKYYPWYYALNGDLSQIKTVTFQNTSGQKFTPPNDDLGCLFWGMSNLTQINGLDQIDTHYVVVFSSLFNGCQSLDSTQMNKQIAALDLSSANTTTNMFNGCTGLTQLDLSPWQKSADVLKASNMFQNCTNLTTINLGNNFFKNSFTDISGMFSGDTALTTISNLDLLNVTGASNLSNLFNNCQSLTTLDLSNWKVGSKAKTVALVKTFQGCTNLTSISGLDKWNTNNVTAANGLFYKCTALKDININNWGLDKATNLGSMFSYCSSLKTIACANLIGSKNQYFDNLFVGDSQLVQLDLEKLNMKSSTAQADMFTGTKSLCKLTLSPYLKLGTSCGLRAAPGNGKAFSTDPTEVNPQHLSTSDSWQELGSSVDDYHANGHLYSNNGLIKLYPGTNNPTTVQTYVWQSGWWGLSLDTGNLVLFDDGTHSPHQPQATTTDDQGLTLGTWPWARYAAQYINSATVNDKTNDNQVLFSNASGLFANCPNLKTVSNLNDLSLDGASIDHLFYKDVDIKQLDLTNFDTTKTTDKTNFLAGLTNLWKITLGKQTELTLNANLPPAPGQDTAFPEDDNYQSLTNNWQEVKPTDTNLYQPSGPILTNAQIEQRSLGQVQTYIWQPSWKVVLSQYPSSLSLNHIYDYRAGTAPLVGTQDFTVKDNRPTPNNNWQLNASAQQIKGSNVAILFNNHSIMNQSTMIQSGKNLTADTKKYQWSYPDPANTGFGVSWQSGVQRPSLNNQFIITYSLTDSVH